MRNETLYATMNVIRMIRSHAAVKTKKNFDEFLSTRITQACSQSCLLDAIEWLSKSCDAAIELIGAAKSIAFLRAANEPDAPNVLNWLRNHPQVATMIAKLHDDEYEEAIDSLLITESTSDDSVISTVPTYQFPIKITTLSPLAHGSDQKAGNATLFRRQQFLTDTGKFMSIPFYAGNAIRGQLRDILADHFLTSIGIKPRRDQPMVALWFFHALYAGGALTEATTETKLIVKELGNNGALRTDGMRTFRQMLPALSLLGCALGNKIISGRLAAMGNLYPLCREMGGGKLEASQLMEWNFITRRDDHEGRGEEEKSANMIANTECLKSGAVLIGGCDLSAHASEIESSALGLAMKLFAEHGMIGAENRHGFGRIKVEAENMPDPELYLMYLAENKEAILGYLGSIDALAKEGK